MKNKTKLLIFIGVIAISLLACSTLTGGGNNTGNTSGDTTGNTTGNTAGNTTGNDTGGDTGGDTIVEPTDILYQDDFSDPNTGWDIYTDEDGLTDYENGAYKIGIYTDTYFYWANPYQNFGDVIVEVEAQKTTGGDDMQYGVICRHLDVDNWYALVISGDGFAAIRKRYQGGDLEYIADWVQVGAVNTGNSTNTLRAECVGSRLSLYVNDTLAIETNDADIASGDVGLMAGTFDQSNTEVLFDNFVVRKP
ncbi:MAG: hypothetical protein P8046_04530 [Anaerolineales bacterium]